MSAERKSDEGNSEEGGPIRASFDRLARKLAELAPDVQASFAAELHDLSTRLTPLSPSELHQALYSRMAITFEAAEDGFFTLDSEWRFTTINRQALKRFNLQPEDLIGKSIWETFPQLIGTITEAEYRKVRDTRIPSRFESPGVLTGAWYEINAYPLDGGLMVHWQDITERKAAEAERERLLQENRQQRELLEAIFESISIGLAVCTGPEFTFQLVNPAYQALSPQPHSNLIGKRARDVWSSPDDLPTEQVEQLMASGKTLFLERLSRRGADGSLHYYNIQMRPITWQNQPALLIMVEDITNYEMAMQALIKSETEYRTLIENSPDSISRFDRQLRYIYVNPATYHGSTLTQEDFIGKRVDELPLTAENTRLFREKLEETFATGQPQRLEFTTPHGGDIRYFSALLVPEKSQDGSVETILAVARDVTERHKSEERLNHMALVLESVHDAIMATDPNEVITFWNHAAEELYGYTREEALGQVASHLLRAEYRPEERIEAQNQINAHGYITLEVAQYTKDNRRVIIDGTVYPIRDKNGEITGYAIANRDITATKEAEQALENANQALRETSNRFREVLESITEGYFVLDKDWRFTEINAVANRQLFRRPRSELIGQVIWEAIPSARGSIFEQQYRRAVEEGQPVHFEAESAADPGWFEVHAYPRQGSLEVYIREITSRKQAEAALSSYAAQLERVNRELERANRELRDFASIASHDLQEPLRKVKAFSDILRERYDHVMDDAGRQYLRRMTDSTHRMQNMIEGLLEYSRISTQEIPFVRVNLTTIAEEVVSDLEVRIANTQGQVQIEKMPVIDANPLQMRQLLQNLIGNALKFHRPCVPPVVRVWAEDVSMPGTLSHAPGSVSPYIQIMVEDNGIGFNEQYINRIFQPFQRLHGSSEYEGTGMGLAICAKIVERHGGKITARSTVGQGTTMIITLPRFHPF